VRACFFTVCQRSLSHGLPFNTPLSGKCDANKHKRVSALYVYIFCSRAVVTVGTYGAAILVRSNEASRPAPSAVHSVSSGDTRKTS